MSLNPAALLLAGIFSSLAPWQFWLLLVVLLLVVEVATVMLISIWFAVGALGAMLASLLGASTPVQILVFLLLSALTIAVSWHFRDRIFVGPRRRTPTNADRIIGQQAEVIVALDPVEGTGLIRVRGQTWSAETVDATALPEGSQVRVTAIRGVKAIVEAAPAAAADTAGPAAAATDTDTDN
ncbi:MAG: NfeD family protein [Bacillota bacterium]|nr:NfeD family protein [Bacillota bacterium]